jgi:hypothetical protein
MVLDWNPSGFRRTQEGRDSRSGPQGSQAGVRRLRLHPSRVSAGSMPIPAVLVARLRPAAFGVRVADQAAGTNAIYTALQVCVSS